MKDRLGYVVSTPSRHDGGSPDVRLLCAKFCLLLGEMRYACFH